MKKKTLAKRKLHRECWNLDNSFVKWLHEHLVIYLHDASRIVDLDYHTFEHRGKTYTQKQLIEMLIRLTNEFIKSPLYPDQQYLETLDEICDIWKMILPSMWW